MEQMQYERSDRIPDTGPERVERHCGKLLALDYITMEELRQILYASRSTLNQDMRQVRRLLSFIIWAEGGPRIPQGYACRGQKPRSGAVWQSCFPE